MQEEIKDTQADATPETAENTAQPETKVFTQDEVNRVVAERLKREREKYRDYDELKRIAEEYKKLQEAQMSEAEKAQKRLAELEREKMEMELRLREMELEMTKQRVLEELGLPRSLASRVLGTTEEEIRHDAEELKRLIGSVGVKQVGSGTNPPATAGIENPWKRETFNLTKQAEILRTNPALAQRLMAEAGK